MQFKVKGFGRTVWKRINNVGFAIGAVDTLQDGQIVDVDDFKFVYAHVVGKGWTKRVWLQAVETPPPATPGLEARVADLECRVTALEAK